MEDRDWRQTLRVEPTALTRLVRGCNLPPLNLNLRRRTRVLRWPRTCAGRRAKAVTFDAVSHTRSAITVHIYTLDGQSVAPRGGHLLGSKDRFVIVVSRYKSKTFAVMDDLVEVDRRRYWSFSVFINNFFKRCNSNSFRDQQNIRHNNTCLSIEEAKHQCQNSSLRESTNILFWGRTGVANRHLLIYVFYFVDSSNCRRWSTMHTSVCLYVNATLELWVYLKRKKRSRKRICCLCVWTGKHMLCGMKDRK